MTKTEIRWTIKLLDELIDEMHNRSCNDYPIKDTPENRVFAKAAKGGRLPKDDLYDGKIFMFDTEVAGQCRYSLKQELRRRAKNNKTKEKR